MTIDGYAIDIASYQAGLNLSTAHSEGFSAVFVKCTDGTSYVNPYYAGWQANRGGFPAFMPYHYLEASSSAAAQLAWFQRNVGFATKWAMLDIEDGSGNAVQIRTAVQTFKAAGYRVALYLPKWYWQEIGSPDMSGWGVDLLISSGYPSTASGAASTLYSAAGSSGWASYGGLTPGIWQFTDRASVAGQSVDANAIASGVLAQLENGTGGGVAAPPPSTQIIADPAHHNPFTPVAVDGGFGPKTIQAMQLITYSGHVGLASGNWSLDDRRNLQQYVGVTMDGNIGPATVTALQNKLKADGMTVTVDGDWGAQTTEALQTALNEGKF